MANLTIGLSNRGNALQEILQSNELVPGADPSYQMCKTIYMYHPLGAKMAESPIRMAQFMPRIINVPDSPEEKIVDAFVKEWSAIGADKTIFNVMRLARVYGVASLALLVNGTQPNAPVNYEKLADADISFNVFDPLNTAGSLVLNQQPNAMDFLKVQGISVQGASYHRSRTVTILNEEPVFLGYTTSAFGYVGRSVYQRALYPMKSFVQSLVTDDLITLKSGLLVAKMKQPGSIVDSPMLKFFGFKRELLKEAQTGNVLGISTEEEIESLNLQNLDGAFSMARKNILENIAVAADMPAKLLNAETFVEGFGEGTEDAKNVARYIDRIRTEMQPLYAFFDKIVQHRAWNEDFYKTVQKLYPEQYGQKTYQQAFYEWTNSFAASWPSLLTEPESEKIKVDDTKLKAIIAFLEVLIPELDPQNKADAIRWGCDNLNEMKRLFAAPLDLDYEALAEYEPPVPGMGGEGGLEEPKPGKPFAANDSLAKRDDSRRRKLIRLLETMN